MMTSSTFTTAATVTGMHCGHCAASVKEEVATLPGVQDVSVDLPSGVVRVSAERPIDHSELGRAIVEAGFELAAAPVG
jgi:copper chaperone CopZ